MRAYRDRPRGWVRSDLVQPGPSPLAGTGLFASTSIPSGTVLGAYPGRPRSWEEMKEKESRAPGCKQYVFTTGVDDPTVLATLRHSLRLLESFPAIPPGSGHIGGGIYLDPTSDCGTLPSPFPSPGTWWPFPVAVELAYANEPAPGSVRGGPNCTVEDGDQADAELLFVVARDIAAGEEILIDYGQHYDRSGYQQGF